MFPKFIGTELNGGYLFPSFPPIGLRFQEPCQKELFVLGRESAERRQSQCFENLLVGARTAEQIAQQTIDMSRDTAITSCPIRAAAACCRRLLLEPSAECLGIGLGQPI